METLGQHRHRTGEGVRFSWVREEDPNEHSSPQRVMAARSFPAKLCASPFFAEVGRACRAGVPAPSATPWSICTSPGRAGSQAKPLNQAPNELKCMLWPCSSP